MKSYHIDINTTKNCNLRCTYCFEVKENQISDRMFEGVDDLLKFIDNFISTDHFKQTYSDVSLNFWGGEPTLNVELYKTIIKKYKDNPVVRFFLYTNGYSFTDYYINSFKELQKINVNGHPKIVVQVSFDGQPIHDFDRITANNNGSSEKIRQSIKRLIDEDIFYVTKSTITPENFKYMYESYLDVISLTKHGYFPTIDLHREYDDVEEYKKYGQDLYENLIKIAAHELKTRTNHFKWFKDSKSLCSAGYNMIAIDINGTIMPCHGALYTNYDEHVIAHISDPDAVEKTIKTNIEYGKHYTKQPPACLSCSSGFCLRCNIMKFYYSKKDDYFDKWTDHDNQDYLCYYFDIINTVSKAKQRGM